MPSKTRLYTGAYVIDIHVGPERVYYAIRKPDCPEILCIGDELTVHEAEAAARWTIAEWEGTSHAKAAAATFPDDSVA